ncbi:SDR family NAD(P)-dependent oxidoreductase [Dactylosporangium sp. CA-092794]|uniref:SDR family NAD(P)-dependent oxidoreductase n=1 Tax=Dactylosporangium sp. CA-092794 TaxID=3239929 RepID=UPI003D8B73A4
MPRDYMHETLQRHVARGEADSGYWWDEDRIPLDTIDKRVPELLDLTGKKAVVTGGAGLNLGQACVNRLAGLGADVAVVDLEPDAAQRSGRQRWAALPDAEGVAQQAAKKWGANVFPVYGDVMHWDSVQDVLARCHDRLGGIDILVNNAADTANGDFATMTREDIDRSVQGTLVGTLYCSRVVLDYMIPQASGRIINIGSEAGLSAMPRLTLYGSLKAGLATFTRFLGKEVAHHGIQVLGVNAGSMWGPNRPVPTDVAETLYPRARTAIQRYELPEEVANMVAFLASDAASCMTGTMVDMGGGMSI